VDLTRPAPQYLTGYSEALRRGWSPDNTRDATGAEELQAIASDPTGFLEGLTDPDARVHRSRFRALPPRPPIAREQGLPHVDSTTDLDNNPSQLLILANGGLLQGRFRKTAHFDNAEALLYRIFL